jgi:hypothetical protein
LLYNPVFRVHLNRELWSVVNVVTIGIALASIFVFKVKKEKTMIPDCQLYKKKE